MNSKTKTKNKKKEQITEQNTKNNILENNISNITINNVDNFDISENTISNNIISENNETTDPENNENVVLLKKSEYSYSKKLELVKKINKIKKKEYLINIFKIITSTSNDYTENTNGVFIFFHNLPDEVYDKIEKYLNDIYKMHIKSDIKNIFNSDISESNNITDSLYNNTIELDNINKDLTNKEKMILRRKKYEEYLQQNQNIT